MSSWTEPATSTFLFDLDNKEKWFLKSDRREDSFKPTHWHRNLNPLTLTW